VAPDRLDAAQVRLAFSKVKPNDYLLRTSNNGGQSTG